MEEKTSGNHDLVIPVLEVESKSGINNEKTYASFFKLFTINAVKKSFLRDVKSEVHRAVLFRCDAEDLTGTRDFKALFKGIFADYEAKDQALTKEEDFDYAVRYPIYRDNFKKLLLIWETMEKSSMFSDKAETTIINPRKGTNKISHSKEAIYNFAKENINNIKKTILFLHKWGEYIVMMIEEQRKSLIIANQKCRLDNGRKAKVLSLQDSDLSVTRQALLQPNFNLQALQEKFNAQFSNALDLLATVGLNQKTLKKTKSGGV